MAIFCTETGLDIRRQLRRELTLPPKQRTVRFMNDHFRVPAFKTPDLRSYPNHSGEEFVANGAQTSMRRRQIDESKLGASPKLPAKSYTLSPIHSDRGLRPGRMAEIHQFNMKKRSEFLANLRSRVIPPNDLQIKLQIDALVSSHYHHGSRLLKATRMQARRKERIGQRLKVKFEQGWEKDSLKNFLQRNSKAELKAGNKLKG